MRYTSQSRHTGERTSKYLFSNLNFESRSLVRSGSYLYRNNIAFAHTCARRGLQNDRPGGRWWCHRPAGRPAYFTNRNYLGRNENEESLCFAFPVRPPTPFTLLPLTSGHFRTYMWCARIVARFWNGKLKCIETKVYPFRKTANNIINGRPKILIQHFFTDFNIYSVYFNFSSISRARQTLKG